VNRDYELERKRLTDFLEGKNQEVPPTIPNRDEVETDTTYGFQYRVQPRGNPIWFEGLVWYGDHSGPANDDYLLTRGSTLREVENRIVEWAVHRARLEEDRKLADMKTITGALFVTPHQPGQIPTIRWGSVESS